MFVFGGCTLSRTTFNDLWKIDLRTKKKSRVLTTGNYPTPKSHATMVEWRDSLVLFGGWTSPCLYPLHQQGLLFNELHVYSATHNTWTQFYFSDPPPPTAGHSATVHNDIIVFFGGLQKLSETSCSSNDIYCLDMAHSTWFKPVVSENAPSPRYGHTQTKIDERHVMIMSGFGGYNNIHNDVWLLTLPDHHLQYEVWTWKQITVEGNQFMPKQVWCNPVCKVDDNLVLLARQNESQNEGMISKPQFLFRAERANPQQWIPPRGNPPAAGERVLQNDIPAPLAAPPRVRAPTLNRLEAPVAGNSPSIASHSRPSVRPNASSNRERRLLMLAKLEDRMKTVTRQQAKILAAPVKAEKTKPTCTQVQYIY